MEIKVGIKNRVDDVVTVNNVASAIGSGGISVYATPWMVALMEKASLTAIAPFLDKGFDSVGTKISTSHLSATPIGMKIYAEAEVIEVDRKRIVFSVKAYDERGLIGEGEHERFIIDTEKFLEKTNKK